MGRWRTVRALPLALVGLGVALACGGPGDAAGRYVLDHELTRKLAEDRVAQRENGAADALRHLRLVEDLSMILTLRPDGTFSTKMKMKEPHLGHWTTTVTSGDWSLEGEDLTIRRTHVDGKEADPVGVSHGTLERDRIRLESEGMPLTLILRRRDADPAAAR